MFPIIPPNLTIKTYNNCTETISSFVTGSSKLLVPGKVVAAGDIPEGASTERIGAEKLLGQPDIVQISAQMDACGMLELESKSKEIWCEDTHWIRALRLSDDCHSYNVQLKLQSSTSTLVEPSGLILQAVKPIETGQELLLWFSEEILAVLQIAFLTPANIQGQKKYVCTKCSALYESPNPLKLHISLACGRYNIVSLWEKLSSSIRDNCLNSLTRKMDFNFKLSPEPQLNRQRNAIDLSVTTNTETSKDLYRPYSSELSAFKPFRKAESAENSQLWPNFSFVSNYQLPHHHQQQQQQNFGENEAHIETLVSSLGKSKQGHICLYCGKCYSRKYGLKIHIRTHTGYKPLKCKYCLRPFGDPSNLNKHVRLHAEGNTPYRCDLCGKVLVRRRDLDRHLKSRHLIDIHPGMNLIQETSNLDDNRIEDNTKD